MEDIDKFYHPKMNWDLLDRVPLENVKRRLDSLAKLAQNIETRIPIEPVNRTDYEERAAELTYIQEDAYTTCQLFWSRRSQIPIEPEQVLSWYNTIHDRACIAIGALEKDIGRTEGEKRIAKIKTAEEFL